VAVRKVAIKIDNIATRSGFAKEVRTHIPTISQLM
jgi:hypothetical protein